MGVWAGRNAPSVVEITEGKAAVGMVCKLVAEGLQACDKVGTERGLQSLFVGGLGVLIAHLLLPRCGEDEVDLIVKIPLAQSFPLAAVKSDAAGDRAVDAEGKSMADLVAGHQRAGLGADSGTGWIHLGCER